MLIIWFKWHRARKIHWDGPASRGNSVKYFTQGLVILCTTTPVVSEVQSPPTDILWYQFMKINIKLHSNKSQVITRTRAKGVNQFHLQGAEILRIKVISQDSWNLGSLCTSGSQMYTLTWISCIWSVIIELCSTLKTQYQSSYTWSPSRGVQFDRPGESTNTFL